MGVSCLLPGNIVIREIRCSHCDRIIVLNLIGGSWDKIVSKLLSIGYSSCNIYKQLHETRYLNGVKKKFKYSMSTRKKINRNCNFKKSKVINSTFPLSVMVKGG